MALRQDIADIFGSLTSPRQEDTIGRCLERPQFRMGLQIEAICSLGEFEEVSKAICTSSLCEASGQNH